MKLFLKIEGVVQKLRMLGDGLCDKLLLVSKCFYPISFYTVSPI